MQHWSSTNAPQVPGRHSRATFLGPAELNIIITIRRGRPRQRSCLRDQAWRLLHMVEQAREFWSRKAARTFTFISQRSTCAFTLHVLIPVACCQVKEELRQTALLSLNHRVCYDPQSGNSYYWYFVSRRFWNGVMKYKWKASRTKSTKRLQYQHYVLDLFHFLRCYDYFVCKLWKD